VRVLVCGAGIAGLTLAFWLLDAGIEPVVVEKAPVLREAAFAKYEAWLRPHIRRIQAQALAFAPTFVPRNRLRVFLTHWPSG
jgi:2-polyprenyl-6-methoxyphenol hydroxylase-like FAD-dependent oxidoreductase